ncbi:MAG TPA: hypothetical protein ENJ28_09125 [Gammaproteobacteria bacterium]|nr:hypothetical protein [Gammaproteobacteria bacterium]
MKKMLISTALVTALTLPTMLFAAEMEDVIYLNNGSIIRGTIVENIPKEGIYKIQTANGNVFVYEQDDIDKITKEAKTGAAQGGVVVNINNTNTNTNTNEAKPAAAAPAVVAPPKEEQRRHSIGIGSYGITFKDKDDLESKFAGGALTYQYGINNHIAFRASIYSTEHEDNKDTTNGGMEGHFLLTNNARNKGFKIYIGAGGYSETMKNKNSSTDKKYSGGSLIIGLGYNFDRVAIDLVGTGRKAEDYDMPKDTTVGTGSFSIAYRY